MVHPNRKTVSRAAKEAAWLKTQGRCWYCGYQVGDGQKSRYYATYPNIDHQTPVARGGTNDPDNLVFACAKCNRTKKSLTLEEFRGHLTDTTPWWLQWSYRQMERWTYWPHGDFERELLAYWQMYIGAFRQMRVVFYGETIGMDLADNYVI